MKLTDADLRDLRDLAISAATAAGGMIARSRPVQVEHKAGAPSPASQVVTDIDRRSEAMIVDHLGPTLDRFELGLLTEERQDDGSRQLADHFWSVDPLDGTLPFVEGSAGYAVSIALVRRDGTPLIGVVYDPVEATLWHAVAGAGTFRDQRRWTASSGRTAEVLSVFADRSLVAGGDRDAILRALGEISRAMGLHGIALQPHAGAVMNACGVLDKPAACYVKFPAPGGGGSLWDFSATACLLREAGGVATDIHGDPLDLNRPDSTFMNHRGALFASDAELAERLRPLGRVFGTSED